MWMVTLSFYPLTILRWSVPSVSVTVTLWAFAPFSPVLVTATAEAPEMGRIFSGDGSPLPDCDGAIVASSFRSPCQAPHAMTVSCPSASTMPEIRPDASRVIRYEL